MSGVALVQFSELNLEKFLTLGRQGLDRSLSTVADSGGVDPPLHHMLCVASMKADVRPTAEACRPYLNLFHAGFLVVADERDFAEVFEISGMPSLMVPTVERGLSMAFISGTLSQWKDAVLRGCQKEVSRDVRDLYNNVYSEFKKLRLAGIFESQQRELRDQTFYLEQS